MRFHFQLESILRIRQQFERRARERLEQALSTMRKLEEELANANQWTRECVRSASASAGVPAAELQFIDSVLSQTRRAIGNWESQRRCQEENVERLRATYLRCRSEFETLNTLRQHALAQFTIEQARREQSALDEAFLGKLVHSRTSSPPTEHDRNLTSSP